MGQLCVSPALQNVQSHGASSSSGSATATAAGTAAAASAALSAAGSAAAAVSAGSACVPAVTVASRSAAMGHMPSQLIFCMPAGGASEPSGLQYLRPDGT